MDIQQNLGKVGRLEFKLPVCQTSPFLDGQTYREVVKTQFRINQILVDPYASVNNLNKEAADKKIT